MNETPLLSVIIPVYNVEQYLCQCLDSILAQDFDDYEVILVDDGSTDKSGVICDQYAREHTAFRCIHKANGGHTSARKCGYEASRGEYISFVDSDDWIAPDMYHKICQVIRHTHADIIHFGYIAAMPDKEETWQIPFSSGCYDKKRLEKEIYPRMLYAGTYFKYGISPNLWNKIFRRELLRKHLFQVPNEITVGEDALTTYSCMLEASSMYFMEEAFYYYRSNDSSTSHSTVPFSRLSVNHRMFDTLHSTIDISSYPYMEQQIYYFIVYQCLLTYVLVFQNMTRASHNFQPENNFRQAFLEECRYPLIHKAFSSIPVKAIGGMHNKLYALCVRHGLAGLFRFLLKRQ